VLPGTEAVTLEKVHLTEDAGRTRRTMEEEREGNFKERLEIVWVGCL
jgi:hypothetical protein